MSESAQQMTQWVEPATHPTVSNETHPVKGSRCTRAEIRQFIQLRQAGLSYQKIADATKRDVATVYENLQVYESTADLAKAKLESAAEDAADSWIGSLKTAAAAANHKPAKELLEAIGVVQKQADTAIAVQVNMPTGGRKLPPELSVIDADTDNS